MFVLGLLILAAGALVIAAGILTIDAAGPAEFLGLEVGDLAIFLIGLGAGVAVWWGYALIRMGIRRSMAHRKEQKRLAKLSQELEKVEAERHEKSAPSPTRTEERPAEETERPAQDAE